MVGSNSVIEVINPANGEKIASVPRGGKAEAITAVDRATAAFQEWSERTFNEMVSSS